MQQKELIPLFLSNNIEDIKLGVGIARGVLDKEELRDLKRALYNMYPNQWIVFGPPPKDELGPTVATVRFWADKEYSYKRIIF